MENGGIDDRAVLVLIVGIIYVLVDWVVFRAIKHLLKTPKPWHKWLRGGYWGITVLTLLGIIAFALLPVTYLREVRTWISVGVFINVISKGCALLVVVLFEARRVLGWLTGRRGGAAPSKAETEKLPGKPISRGEFMAKAAIAAAALPAGTLSFGILYGAHHYRVVRQTITLPKLPHAFHGIRIAQLSDIHSGSFFNRRAVMGGVEMLLQEKPDLAVFTGDLVNEETDEVKEYIDVFNKVKAPLGVYSILGNHDYGDYRTWPSAAAKQANMEAMYQAHQALGWQLLRNANTPITVDGQHIALLGSENWGKGRFSKFGDIHTTYRGSGEAPVKILLSHDPSHWDAHVRPNYPDVDLTLSGHTHGFQFGVEAGFIKWSPSQYLYPQWAGHYQEAGPKGTQHIYVNRGFGYIGYPGRVGVWPEITIITLERG